MTDTVLTGDGGGPKPVDSAAPDAAPEFSVPDEYKAQPWAANIKSSEDMWNQMANVQKLVGADRLPVPKEDWTPEQQSEFWNKIGRPESPDGYKVPEVELPDGLKVEDGQFDSFLEKAHSVGLTGKQAQEILAYYMGDQAESYKAGIEKVQTEAREAREALMTEWGDKAEGNIGRSMELVKQVGSPELLDKINASGLGRDADFIKFLEKASRPFSEDNARGDGQQIVLGGVAKAQAEKAQLQADPQFMKVFMDKFAPGHKDAVDRMYNLQEIIAGQ